MADGGPSLDQSSPRLTLLHARPVFPIGSGRADGMHLRPDVAQESMVGPSRRENFYLCENLFPSVQDCLSRTRQRQTARREPGPFKETGAGETVARATLPRIRRRIVPGRAVNRRHDVSLVVVFPREDGLAVAIDVARGKIGFGDQVIGVFARSVDGVLDCAFLRQAVAVFRRRTWGRKGSGLCGRCTG